MYNKAIPWNKPDGTIIYDIDRMIAEGKEEFAAIFQKAKRLQIIMMIQPKENRKRVWKIEAYKAFIMYDIDFRRLLKQIRLLE